MISPALQALFRHEGAAVSVRGNTPFFLSDDGAVWWIECGGVEVFSVGIEADAPAGSRQPFCSLGAGHAIFGVGPPAGGRGLLAVGLPETRLRRLPLARVRAWAADPRFSADLAQLLEAWIAALSLGISRDVSVRTDCLIEPTDGQDIADGTRFRAKRGVLWLAPEAGDLLFIGMEEITLTSRAVLFPVGQDAWLQTLGPARVQVYPTAAVIARDGLWDGLALFFATLIRCEALNHRLGLVDDLNRQNDRDAAARRATRRALDELVAVLAAPIPTPDSAVEDPLFRTCLVLGREQAIAFRPPPELLKGEALADPVAAIARASRVRVRTVALTGQWWKADSTGPLLVFFTSGHRPAALLPARSGGYVLHAPHESAARPVTAASAAELEPAGFEFYRSFGDAALTGWELLRFGALNLRADAVRLLLAGLGGGVLSTLPAFAMAVVFGQLVPAGTRGLLLQLTIGLVGLAAAVASFEIVRGFALLRLEGRLDHTLQAAVMDRLLKLPVRFFRNYSAGDLAQRVHGIDEIRRLVSAALVTAGLGSLFAWVNLAVLFVISPSAAALAAGLLGLVGLFTVGVTVRQLGAQRAVALEQGRISGLVLQFITGIAKLRVAAAEEFAFSAWARLFARQKRAAFHARRLGNHLNVFNAAFPLLATAAIFWCVAHGPDGARLPVGQFLAFATAFTALITGSLALTYGAALAVSAVPLFERVKPILEARPEDDGGKRDPGALGGRIELSQLSFRYAPETPLILDRLSLEIAPGELIAIVGASGSGKSTLLRLLLGFDAPQTGAILYDGQDLNTLDVAAVRRQIGVVLQASRTSAGTILDNIVGSRRFSDDEAWEALRLAGLAEDIRAMPMGLRTLLPPGGGVLSGGQRQRLAIARALIGAPRILLFDEATSALDNRTQAIVSASLAQLQATRIVIAHRLSTIRGADRIFVFDAGRVVQSGRFEELLGQPGPFRQLACRQLTGPDQEATEGE